MSDAWTRTSWRERPALQMPEYPDPVALASTVARLSSYPPLVFAGEAHMPAFPLRVAPQVSHGRACIGQRGDAGYLLIGRDERILKLKSVAGAHLTQRNVCRQSRRGKVVACHNALQV